MSQYHPINIGLSPNTERDDIVLAMKLLINPTTWIRGHAVKKLEEVFAEWLPRKYAYATRSGRSALTTAVRALSIKEGDEVLIQSYTCAAVPNAVMWAGAKPVYVDIDENTLNISPADLEKKITAKSKAIIVQHAFGLPANLRKIIAIAKRHNLFLIEDCALSLGAKYKENEHYKRVGTFGDISIFSFGRDKVISGVCGGMITTNNGIFTQKIKAEISKDKLPPIPWTVQQLLHPILMNRVILPVYGLASIGKFLLEALKTIHVMPKVIHPSEKVGEKSASFLGLMPNSLAVLALHQFKKLEKFNFHREKIARIYNEGLKNLVGKNFKLPVEETDSKRVYLRYTIITNKAHEILTSARKENMILGDWYRPSIAPRGVSFSKMQYNPDTCPAAEHCSRYSLNLPTNIRTSESDARKVVEFIKRRLQ